MYLIILINLLNSNITKTFLEYAFVLNSYLSGAGDLGQWLKCLPRNCQVMSWISGTKKQKNLYLSKIEAPFDFTGVDFIKTFVEHVIAEPLTI